MRGQSNGSMQTGPRDILGGSTFALCLRRRCFLGRPLGVTDRVKIRRFRVTRPLSSVGFGSMDPNRPPSIGHDRLPLEE